MRAAAFIAAVPADVVGEIHVVGHSVEEYGGERVIVDTHDAPACAEVWDLYAFAIARCGRVPTLVEWDSKLPELDVLIDEARKADQVMEDQRALAA